MPARKRFIASLDQVKVTREGDTAIIEYADPRVGATYYKMGRVIHKLTDQQILDHFNEHLALSQKLSDEYEHVAVEVPVGKPQLEYHERADQWVPRGDVVRCLIHDSSPGGEPVIEVDDRELSWAEFGRMMTTYAGWGARIIFVPDDETHLEPTIEIREPVERDQA